MRFFLTALLVALGLPTAAQIAPGDSPADERRPPLFVLHDDDSRVYLLGSVHVLPQGALPLPPHVESAYAGASVVAFELDLDAAQAGVAERGYANLSMRQIARAVGCSVGTIYLYYANKNALYSALVDEAVVHLVASYASAYAIEDPVERLEAFCRSYVAFAMRHPEEYKVMYLELDVDPGEVSPEAYRRARKPLDDTAAVLAEADAAGLLDVPSPKDGAVFVWAALHGILSLILARQVDPRADPGRLIDLTVGLIIDSFRPKA